MISLSKFSLTIVMALVAQVVSAQDSSHAGHGPQEDHAAHAGNGTFVAAELTDGEIKKIDKEAGKITMRHGEIKNLNMAAMTMVLRVQDPGMLDQVKAGDKVQFAADRINGAVTIVQMRKAP